MSENKKLIIPLDERLVNDCKTVFESNAKKKGNSWIEIDQKDAIELLMNKYHEESAEFVFAMTHKEHNYMARRELLDMINVCAMLYWRLLG